MAEGYIGEIRMFSGNFAPREWALCQGQLLDIPNHQELFSLLGIRYGGDGRTNFALPDLRGRVPMHQGTGPGLRNRRMGQMLGYEMVSLTQDTMPAHSHYIQASQNPATSSNPDGLVLAKSIEPFYDNVAEKDVVSLSDEAVGESGGNQPHYNMQPFLGMNFIISLNGVYPPRN